MNREKIIHKIPNTITLIRILGSLCLIFISPLTAAFYIIYTMCGITDVLDGMIARAAKTESKLGARLDSIADLIFHAVMLFWIFNLLWNKLPAEIWCTAAFAAVLRVFAMVTASIKYKCFAALHTYLNKLTGILVFFILYFTEKNYIGFYCFAVCLISVISSAEELMIHIRQKEYNPNIKSILNCK